MNSYKFTIFGRVQGVWYRKYVMQIAKTLGFVGYVKNLPSGCVEVVVNLDLQSELESFVSKLYEGSTFSKVKDVECIKIDFIDFEKFEKRT
jgi:acylphosphatase